MDASCGWLYGLTDNQLEYIFLCMLQVRIVLYPTKLGAAKVQ